MSSSVHKPPLSYSTGTTSFVLSLKVELAKLADLATWGRLRGSEDTSRGTRLVGRVSWDDLRDLKLNTNDFVSSWIWMSGLGTLDDITGADMEAWCV